MRVEIRPAFDEAVMAAELPVRKAAAKMLLLLQSLELPQLWSHPGLNFEKLHGMIEPATGNQLYSLRVTGSARAASCLLTGPTIVLVSRMFSMTGRIEHNQCKTLLRNCLPLPQSLSTTISLQSMEVCTWPVSPSEILMNR